MHLILILSMRILDMGTSEKMAVKGSKRKLDEYEVSEVQYSSNAIVHGEVKAL